MRRRRHAAQRLPQKPEHPLVGRRAAVEQHVQQGVEKECLLQRERVALAERRAVEHAYVRAQLLEEPREVLKALQRAQLLDLQRLAAAARERGAHLEVKGHLQPHAVLAVLVRYLHAYDRGLRREAAALHELVQVDHVRREEVDRSELRQKVAQEAVPQQQ